MEIGGRQCGLRSPDASHSWDERKRIALEWLKKVGLSKFAHSYPHELSGGMKQRVIARAFANNPEILLMDEPLAALDAQTRAVLQEELISLWEDLRKTVVYITHSIEEAVLLGDRVILMTAYPGTKKSEFTVPFPRPRSFALTGSAEVSADCVTTSGKICRRGPTDHGETAMKGRKTPKTRSRSLEVQTRDRLLSIGFPILLLFMWEGQ